MLGWITGQPEEQRRDTDESAVMEPPETPAPVFAMRAFRSALFGTPAGDDNGNDNSITVKKHESPVLRRRSAVPLRIETDQGQQQSRERPTSDPVNQLSLSPTKSILVTPGTTSNRRKTVSFHETAVQEETEQNKPLSRSNSAIFSPAGSVTSQWMSSQSDGKSRPRSRLTQSLLDAKERVKEDHPKRIESIHDKGTSVNDEIYGGISPSLNEHDETIDLNDPRSQSGQYWKTEFENYRKRTNLEIKKLIQYRTVAKSYARKKDMETMRLTEKLRKEEEKVADMERRVGWLASDMVSEGIDVDREKLVQDLARQTALAVQYKHKVDSLRKALERNGVVGTQDEQTDSEETYRDDRAEILHLQEALDDANKKLEENNRDDELSKLRNLAEATERKLADVESENALLKQTIARVKGEMGKYEERRSEKEAKLKERANKWEIKYQESQKRFDDYRAKIHEERQMLEYRCQKWQKRLDDYRVDVGEERQMYQQQIQALSQEIAVMKNSNLRVSSNGARRNRESNSYVGIQTKDFGNKDLQGSSDEMLQMSD